MRSDELRTRLRAAVDRWYRPREVLIRTDGRVRYLVLSTNRQIAATAAAGALALAAIATAAGWLAAEYRAGRHADEAREARAAYVELLAEVSRHYDEFSAVARDLEVNEEALLAIIEGQRTGNRTVDVDAIAARVFRSRAVRAESMAGSAGLKEKLDLFATDLRSVVNRNDQLAQNIAILQEQLRAAEEEKEAIFKERDELRAQLELAEAARAKLETLNVELTATLGELEKQFVEVKAERQAEREAAAALRRDMQRLQSELADSTERNVRMERRYAETQRQLDLARAQRHELALVRDRLSLDVVRLKERIASIEHSQQSIVRQLAERTRIGAAEVEKTVAMTGVDVDALLRKVSSQPTGTGGPFVPARERAPMGERHAILATVAPLDLEMSRWEKLQVVLRTLPLSSPLDTYTIGSSFGKRQDPLNGKLAMHEGLDFSAPMGATVLATAPGKVIFAGRKGGYGRMVEIDHGFGIVTRYAHLKEITVETGQVVEYRDKIGKLGSSGRSTGPHVHYEILVDGKPHDPMNFLKAGRYVFKG